MTAPLRIAMWSGPRNISTAMMRAWENREDCAVSDEPLYAHYLAHTGVDHPGADEVHVARHVPVAAGGGPCQVGFHAAQPLFGRLGAVVGDQGGDESVFDRRDTLFVILQVRVHPQSDIDQRH